jgi:hypothetical protein
MDNLTALAVNNINFVKELTDLIIKRKLLCDNIEK